MPELLGTSQVSAMTGTPIETLRYWRHNGIGPSSFKLGRRVVYDAADVRTWLDAQRAASTRGGGA